eukprot:scaffold88681_cov65-Phaeocystis_antarctica.AAC.1
MLCSVTYTCGAARRANAHTKKSLHLRNSYQGWQKAVAEIEERYIEGGMPGPWNDSVLQNNLRPGAVRAHRLGV